MSFKEALEYNPPVLSDYKVLTIAVSEAEIKEFVKNNVYVTTDRLKLEEEIEAEMLASAIALRKAMAKYPITHAVSFHSSIKRSKKFRNIQNSYSESFPEYGELETYHVDGKLASGRRDKILNEFSHSRRSLISNARCLTEGIDVKNIDCVLFADPKKSRVDIVQAVGRTLRLYEGKKYGYVIIPIIIKPEKPEPTAFDEVLTILRAFASNDERIIEYFRAKHNNKRATNGIINVDIDENIAQYIDIEKFIEALETRCWGNLAKLSWRPFGEAREYIHSLDIKSRRQWWEYCKNGKKPDDIPTNPNQIYKDEGWKGMGDWLGTGNISSRLIECRPFNEAREFARSLNLKSGTQWREYCNKGKKPDDIPAWPDRSYKDKGWKGMGDWLGTGNIAN